jgi:hypothetical protein
MVMLGRRFLRCAACRLRWIPQAAKASACPACGSTAVGRSFEPFHAGLLLVLLGLGLGAWQLRDRFSGPPPREARAEDRRGVPAATGRVKVARLVVAVEAGPARGRTVTLRKGDPLRIVDRDGAELLVQDKKGNRMRVKREHVTLP